MGMTVVECLLCKGTRYRVLTENAGYPVSEALFQVFMSSLIIPVLHHLVDAHGWELPVSREVTGERTLYEYDFEQEAVGTARWISLAKTHWQSDIPFTYYDRSILIYPEATVLDFTHTEVASLAPPS